MKRILVCAAAAALLVGASALSVEAGPGKGQSVNAGGPKTARTPKAPKATTAKAGPKASAPKVNAGAGKTAGGGKANAPGQVKRTPAPTPDGTVAPPQVAGKHGTTSPNVPKNPKLQAKLLAMLPPGMTLDEAAAGFKNQGQFVASVRVSNNLGIPFEDLKVQMVEHQASLGQAIQTLRPDADGTTEATRAEKQARRDLKQGRKGSAPAGDLDE